MLALLLILFGGGAPPTAGAAGRWSFDGHRLICQIAWRELTPRVRERVQALITADTTYSRFAESCSWADEIRRDPRYRRFITAHYVNLPRDAAGLDLARDCGETYCVVEAIDEMAALLADTAAGVERRLEALKFLGHFVGDIHQPLHAGYGDDRGGNDTRVQLDGQDVNLHWVWDGLLLERMGMTPADAERLHAAIRAIDRSRWADLSPRAWAEESYQLVAHQVYRGAEGGSISPEYVQRNWYAIERQVMKAGFRLGLLLNETLGG